MTATCSTAGLEIMGIMAVCANHISMGIRQIDRRLMPGKINLFMAHQAKFTRGINYRILFQYGNLQPAVLGSKISLPIWLMADLTLNILPDILRCQRWRIGHLKLTNETGLGNFVNWWDVIGRCMALGTSAILSCPIDNKRVGMSADLP